ncbi:MAG: hypothetical protein EOM87_01740, partial [Clostridia bacterium]|nr:hypothetical protein [Clostridia bacterium]
MRKLFYALSIMVIFISMLCLVSCGTDREQYIRIHIRANSNEELDQTVKLEVRDAVIKFLMPFAQLAKDKNEMMSLMQSNIGS